MRRDRFGHSTALRVHDGYFAGLLADRGGAGEEVSQWSVAADVKADAYTITVFVDVPGVQARDLSVTVSGKYLLVTGRRSLEWQASASGYFRVERYGHSFTRRIELPHSNVDGGQVMLELSGGVLKVQIPVLEKNQAEHWLVERPGPLNVHTIQAGLLE
ncbi:MAG: Hsp20/alpha crystallin family protein [Bdellovibrionales bacterium]|nr:Hsp20/alpha crystallin family protein [Bdellovibrionales bacterium]